MNPILDEINQIYIPIQKHILPGAEDIAQATEQIILEAPEVVDEAFSLYNNARDKLNTIISTLSPDEILEGYIEGCRLLRCNLGGYMTTQFNPVYAPLMVDAIRTNHEYTAPLFLQILADQLGSEISPSIISALDSENNEIREKALLVSDQLNLVEALPKVQLMTQDPVGEIAFLAQQVLERLNNEVNNG